MRRLVPLLLVLAGCGSAAPADLPAPAEQPDSPPLAAKPAGRVEAGGVPARVVEHAGRAYSVDRARDLLVAWSDDGRVVGTAPTGREPVALALLDRGKRIAVLTGRERTLEVYDSATLARMGRAGAGIGPTDLATDGVEILYVTDVLGQALLVFHLRPFELIRRVHVAGGPYAIAYDRARWGLWIALAGTNELAYYQAGSRPIIRDTLPSIRNARDVAVDGDLVTVLGRGERQVLRLARTR